MKIVINSHINGSIALNHLLQSLSNVSIDCEIIVVIGGYYELLDYDIMSDGKITYIKCNHNSIDFTGLIALAELYADHVDEYYAYLHDTCKVGDQFYNKLKAIDLTNVSSIKINKPFSMNMGIYSQTIINYFKPFLLSKKNTDASKCMLFKSVNYNEDYVFNNDPTNKILDNYCNWHTNIIPTDYYGTGTMRIVEYYSNLDLYKIKANWGQGTWTLNN